MASTRVQGWRGRSAEGGGVGNAEFAGVDIAGVDNAGVVKSAIWAIIIGYFNNRFMDFNGLFVAALMGNLNTYNDCTHYSK